MNGRCDFHLYDSATDVCDSCYADICIECRIEVKRRKHPLCRECAVAGAALRGNTKPPRRGEKKTVKERRRQYQEAEAEPGLFSFFDQPGEPADDEIADEINEGDELWALDSEDDRLSAGERGTAARQLDQIRNQEAIDDDSAAVDQHQPEPAPADTVPASERSSEQVSEPIRPVDQPLEEALAGVALSTPVAPPDINVDPFASAEEVNPVPSGRWSQDLADAAGDDAGVRDRADTGNGGQTADRSGEDDSWIPAALRGPRKTED